MTLMNDYAKACQQTWKLANKGGTTHLYLGIIGEFGEICDMLKKHIRGDFDKKALKSNIKKEIGDLTWYLITYAHDEGLLESRDEFPKPKESKVLDNIFKMEELKGRLAKVKNQHEKRVILKNLIGKTVNLANNFGYSIEEICKSNIEKTYSRATRGKILGSGNDR